MQKNPTRRESEILKQFLYIREEKGNSLFMGLVLRGETEIMKNYFPISRGEENLNCFHNDNKTRLVKLFLSARGKGHEILQGERDMKFWFSRVREKIWIISPRDFHGIEPLDSVWVGHLCCEPPTGGITIITIVRAKVLLTLVCSTVHFRHSCHSCTF